MKMIENDIVIPCFNKLMGVYLIHLVHPAVHQSFDVLIMFVLYSIPSCFLSKVFNQFQDISSESSIEIKFTFSNIWHIMLCTHCKHPITCPNGQTNGVCCEVGCIIILLDYMHYSRQRAFISFNHIPSVTVSGHPRWLITRLSVTADVAVSSGRRHPWEQSSWSRDGPIWGRQDPGGPHELCYLGLVSTLHYAEIDGHCVNILMALSELSCVAVFIISIHLCILSHLMCCDM